MRKNIAKWLVRLLVLVGGFTILGGSAAAQEWPYVFDPYTLHTFNVEVNPDHWETIRFDQTFEFEVPALFWMDGEEPILVSIRRKSSDAWPSEADPQKVALKLDINEYVDQEWHGLKKLSLESGDEVNVVAEGLAWFMHTLAHGAVGYDYEAAYATWVRVNVNGNYVGLYLSVEQRDKTFLKNRDFYVKNETWLYKIGNEPEGELKVGPEEYPSPTWDALCYEPFRYGNYVTCATPDDVGLAADIYAMIDVPTMMALGAVEALTANPDGLFTHRHNFFMIDQLNHLVDLRKYAPWDLDAAYNTKEEPSRHKVYGRKLGKNFVQTTYQQIILNHPDFREDFNQMVLDLIAGPLCPENALAFLDAVEPVISQALVDDPNNRLDVSVPPDMVPVTVPEYFDYLRGWVVDRQAFVLEQVYANDSPPPREWPAEGEEEEEDTPARFVPTDYQAKAVSLDTKPTALRQPLVQSVRTSVEAPPQVRPKQRRGSDR